MESGLNLKHLPEFVKEEQEFMELHFLKLVYLKQITTLKFKIVPSFTLFFLAQD
jgi:hypothetical protein